MEPGKAELIKFYSESQFEADGSGVCELRIISMSFAGDRRQDAFPTDCAEVQSFVSAHRPRAPQ